LGSPVNERELRALAVGSMGTTHMLLEGEGRTLKALPPEDEENEVIDRWNESMSKVQRMLDEFRSEKYE
jgi:hypothetical protein